MITVLMVVDALVAVALIAAVLGQEPKSAGMGGTVDGSANTVFSSRARGMDAFLAKATVVLAVLFAVVTMVIAKLVM